MAEEDIMMEEDSIALSDTEDSVSEDANINSIIDMIESGKKWVEDYVGEASKDSALIGIDNFKKKVIKY